MVDRHEQKAEKSEFEEIAPQPARQKQKSSSPWKQIFAFTTPKQLSIIACAVATAAVVAAGKTVYTFLLGRVFDFATQYGASAISGQELLNHVSQWCGYITVLGVGMWALSSADMALWITSGEVRAMSARKTLFSRLIQREMDWFDSRGDGMSSLIIQSQG